VDECKPLISGDAVNKAAFVLYTFFGLRLMFIAWRSDPNATMVDEVSEVEEKLEGGAARAGQGRQADPI